MMFFTHHYSKFMYRMMIDCSQDEWILNWEMAQILKMNGLWIQFNHMLDLRKMLLSK